MAQVINYEDFTGAKNMKMETWTEVEDVTYKFTSSETLKQWHEITIAACKRILPNENISPIESFISINDQVIVEFGTDGGDKAKFRVSYQDKELGQKVAKALESAFHAQPYED